jgi:hypothetical protein
LPQCRPFSFLALPESKRSRLSESEQFLVFSSGYKFPSSALL